MKKPEAIPNYYAYTLKVNGRQLTDLQKKHFFNCINKIYRENYKFIYRGDKKDKLQSLYRVTSDHFDNEFYNMLFLMGAKANMLINSDFPSANEIHIARARNNEFSLIFHMLGKLLTKEFPFGATRIAMKGFRATEEDIIQFFRKPGNEQIFVDIIGTISTRQKIIVRDYYLALLHHVSKSEYYPSSFLLSTTSNFSQAYKFAWKGADDNSNKPLILFGWIPKDYEGILSVPDSRLLRRKIDMAALGLPVYEQSFFPIQKEITLKGGLLPYYLLGSLHFHQGQELFEINPALFNTDESWSGIELPIDQSTFQQRIQNTLFGRYFTVDSENEYNQHER
jgi:hypothetical protein